MCIRRSRNVAVLKTTQFAEENLERGFRNLETWKRVFFRNLQTSLFSSAGRKHLWRLETRMEKSESEKSQKVDQRVKRKSFKDVKLKKKYGINQ